MTASINVLQDQMEILKEKCKDTSYVNVNKIKAKPKSHKMTSDKCTAKEITGTNMKVGVKEFQNEEKKTRKSTRKKNDVNFRELNDRGLKASSNGNFLNQVILDSNKTDVCFDPSCKEDFKDGENIGLYGHCFKCHDSFDYGVDFSKECKVSSCAEMPNLR